MGPISPKNVMAHISKMLILSYFIDWVFIMYDPLLSYRDKIKSSFLI